MSRVKITTMVMIEDLKTNQVLIQDRIKKYMGPSFPGGQLEPGESIVDCAVREIKEETGYEISNLILCGIMHWYDEESQERYLEFLFKTATFSGRLIAEMEEGKHHWQSKEKLQFEGSENHFDLYLPLFMNPAFCEGYAVQRKGELVEIKYY